jgi:magnesium and cobalt transporter
MKVVEYDSSLEEILDVVIDSGHSRFPVINEDKDNVVGVLLAKDLLPFSGNESQLRFRLDDIMRKATFTPDTKRLNVLLKEFRSARNHMAIVLDEYGGVDGLVTIEDVLEEIVGEIDDEHDTEEDEDDFDIKDHGDGRFSVRALTPIDEFNETLGTQFSDEEFDTIGGLVMQHIGHMPKPGETASIDGCQFRILSADSRRLHLLQVTPPVVDS